MLEAGDRGFDVTADEKVSTNEGSDARYSGDRAKMRRLRSRLVQAIEQARASQGASASP